MAECMHLFPFFNSRCNFCREQVAKDSNIRFMAASKVLGEEAVVPAAASGEEERKKEREK